MSFDDELKQRMKQAAERAASQADPAKAAARLSAVTSSGTLVTGTVLKVIGGLGALGLATGAVLGVTVLEDDSPAAAAAVVDIDVQQGRTFDCPDGTPVGALQPGDRVYVVGRDEGGNWAALRDPGALGHMVWVPMASLRPDGEPTEVPVTACDEPVSAGMTPDTIATESSLPEDDSTTSTTDAGAQPSTSVAPSPVNPGDGSPTPGPTQAPSPNATPPATTTAPPAPPAPTPPPDTQSPTIQGSASESLIYDASWSDYCPDRSAITFTVADNVGVVSVTATRNGPAGPGVPMTNFGGGLWRTTLGPFSGLGSGYDQPVTVTATVYDAAGNSTSAAVNVRVLGECLI